MNTVKSVFLIASDILIKKGREGRNEKIDFYFICGFGVVVNYLGVGAYGVGAGRM